MFKRLDLLVFRSFIGPFLASTFLMLLMLLFQFFWLYIDDLVGKGLEIPVLAKLIVYISATLLPNCLPIGVLFAALISFGSMGEHFELVSVKAAGISFIRFLQPILIIGIMVSILAFLAANYIVPQANKNSSDLLYSIMVQKPALNINEGVFYDKIDGYIIRVNKKSKDGKVLKEVVIIEKSNKGNAFDNIIFAKEGKMELLKDHQGIVFKLYDGCYYQEKKEAQAPEDKQKNNFYRLFFKEYVRVFQASGFGFKKKENSGQDFKAMRISELDEALRKRKKNFYITPRFLYANAQNYLPVLAYLDTLARRPDFRKVSDTNRTTYRQAKQILAFQDSVFAPSLTPVMHTALKALQYDSNFFKETNNRINVEWHKRFSLAFSCFVFVIIGSSLGAIIRKGGIGLPLIIAVSFFVFYYFFNSSLEKTVSKPNRIIGTFWGLWLSNFIFLPVGIYLAHQVLNDVKVLDISRYHTWIKTRYERYFNKKRKK